MAVLWLDEIGADDLETVGGKGASWENSRVRACPFRRDSS